MLPRDLAPETIRTWELALDHRLGGMGKLTATFFRYRIKDIIEFVTLPGNIYTFVNQGGARARGFEVRYETQWENGGRLNTSYNWQMAESDAGLWLDNSPRHMAKLGIQQPVFGSDWKAGLEIQYMGPRVNPLGAQVGGHTLVNLNLLNSRLPNGLEVSARISNLLDKRYADPASGVFTPLDRIVQDGREWSLRMEYRF